MASLQSQSDRDWTQTILVDSPPSGVGASHQHFARLTPQAEWVWVLDDDDECVYDGLVADVRRQGAGADVIMVRMDHGEQLGVLPDDAVWGKRPIEGHLGCSSFIVRAEVWMAHRDAWNSLRYASDFDFIAAVFGDGWRVVWHDVIASRTQKGRSIGRMEYAVAGPEELR